uniref:Uncharacterized protein n=1 Tax=Mesocestoides corti TaxID=53468 RepID=A0A5K3G3R0_MESCO
MKHRLGMFGPTLPRFCMNLQKTFQSVRNPRKIIHEQPKLPGLFGHLELVIK